MLSSECKNLQAGCQIRKSDYLQWSGETDISSSREEDRSAQKHEQANKSIDEILDSESSDDLDSCYTDPDEIVNEFSEIAANFERGLLRNQTIKRGGSGLI